MFRPPPLPPSPPFAEEPPPSDQEEDEIGSNGASPLPSPSRPTERTSEAGEGEGGGDGGQNKPAPPPPPPPTNTADVFVDDRDETMGVSLGPATQGHLVGVRAVFRRPPQKCSWYITYTRKPHLGDTSVFVKKRLKNNDFCFGGMNCLRTSSGSFLGVV